jgi:hypothetical protein
MLWLVGIGKGPVRLACSFKASRAAGKMTVGQTQSRQPPVGPQPVRPQPLLPLVPLPMPAVPAGSPAPHQACAPPSPSAPPP